MMVPDIADLTGTAPAAAPGCAGRERTACDGSAPHPRRSEHPRISQTRAAPADACRSRRNGRPRFPRNVQRGERGGAEKGDRMLIYRGKLVSGPAALPRLMLRELTCKTVLAGPRVLAGPCVTPILNGDVARVVELPTGGLR